MRATTPIIEDQEGTVKKRKEGETDCFITFVATVTLCKNETFVRNNIGQAIRSSWEKVVGDEGI